MLLLYQPTLLIGAILLLCNVKADPAHIISQNLEQTVTSSTLQWVPTDGSDPTVLKNAVVAAYQTLGETDKPTVSEEVDSTDNDIQKKSHPVYVCRAKITSIWVIGQLSPKNRVCVVSLYKKVQQFQRFEVLVNIDDSARLSWVGKNKYTNIPQGAVTSGENILRTFVARRPTENHNRVGSLTHYVGTFNPSENLGFYHLVDQNNNEISYEDGELLVETEPISYEFKSLKYKRVSSRRFARKQLELAYTTLKNDENGLQKVESVMGYEYDYFLSWGKGHGILTGLPFTVFLPNGIQVEGRWGLAEPSKKSETVPVEKYLEEGTAVNITLIGNYTEMDIPYTATVVAKYRDGERREFVIEDTKRENKVVDVAFEFSPVYFLHNNSHVPTTTTTTTTTTSTTTTSKTTSTTQEVTPMAVPEIIKKRKQDELHAASKKTDGGVISVEDNSIHAASSLEKKPESSASGASDIVSILSVFNLLLIVLLRVT